MTDPRRKRMTRALRSIDAYIQKKLRGFEHAKYVFGVQYMSEYNKTIAIDWKFTGDLILQRKLTSWTPAMETALTMEDDTPDPLSLGTMPANAEKRAATVRRGLRILWQDHVKNTPYADKKQMFSLVKKGLCRNFEWWDRVTENAPFESVSIDDPDVSRKLFLYVAQELEKRS